MAVSRFETGLVFGGTDNVELSEQMLVATIGRGIGKKLHLQLGMGAILGGEIIGPDNMPHQLGVGAAVSIAGTLPLVDQQGARPFVLSTLSLAASRTTSEQSAGSDSSLVATDLRLAAVVGWKFAKRFSVNGAARAFGGPVFWNELDDTGTDRKHVQVGVGVGVELPGSGRVYAEWAFFGEKALGLGLSFSVL